MSFFGFRDDGLRTGFQAGLQRLDGSPRPSSAAVQTAIADAASGCTGNERRWAPGVDVVGAKIAVGGKAAAVTARLAAGEDARARVCVRGLSGRPSAPSRCRSVKVPGLRPLSVAVRPSVALVGRVQVDVAFAAEANRKRRTLLVRQAVLRR